MSCRKKRDLPTCVVKGRRAPGKSFGTWVIMLSLLPQECSTSSRPDPWPPVPSLPPNPKTPLLSAPTPSYSLFSIISSSFTQLPKRSLQPGHPQPSGTPQALGTTQFLTQTLPVESWMKHLLLAWPCVCGAGGGRGSGLSPPGGRPAGHFPSMAGGVPFIFGLLPAHSAKTKGQQMFAECKCTVS